MRLPEELNHAIQEEVGKAETSTLRNAAAEISEAYRSSEGGAMSLSGLGRLAYLAARAPGTYAALCTAIAELRRRFKECEPRSLLDLGAGPGTGAWAVAEQFDSIEKITLVERDIEFSRIGRRLAAHSSSGPISRAEWISANLAGSWTVRQHDLVVFSYALGELEEADRLAVVGRAWEKTGKALLVVEPGSMRGFQNVLAARSELISRGAHILAPCPHEERCPMSANDWCHFSVRIERTSLQRRLKGGTLPYEDEKFSYVVATTEAWSKASGRIVGRPVKAKGHVDLTVCGPSGIECRIVTKRSQGSYRAARKAQWGDEWDVGDSDQGY